MKKKIFFAAVFIAFSSFLFCQEKLGNLNYTWSSILSGKVLQEPVLTDYGFCFVTDAKTICAYSDGGNLLWEKYIGRNNGVVLSSLSDGFVIYIDDDFQKLHLLNADGAEVWNKRLDFSADKKTFYGRDGRFFVRSKNCIQCFGLNGISKWKIQTPLQSEVEPAELQDGSFVVFLQELTPEGKTKSLRISPFGEVLEEIVFSACVNAAVTCSQGILVNFTDGSSGLFAVGEDGFSHGKWVIPGDGGRTLFVTDKKLDVAVHFLLKDNAVLVSFVNEADGKIEKSFEIPDFAGKNLSLVSLKANGLFLADGHSAFLYDLHGNCKVHWILPEKNGRFAWNYYFYSNSNNLVFCQINWTLNAYKAVQNTSSLQLQVSEKTTYSVYKNFSGINFEHLFTTSFDSQVADKKRISLLEAGNYGTKEREYISDVNLICSTYIDYLSSSDFGIRKEVSVFEKDSVGLKNVLSQLCLFGTDYFSQKTAVMLKKVSDRTLLKILLEGVGKNGYDPDLCILSSLEYVAENLNTKERALINLVCDAVYSICCFMGRPAFYSKGKEILTKFLYPSYDAKNRSYARETLKKIADLEL